MKLIPIISLFGLLVLANNPLCAADKVPPMDNKYTLAYRNAAKSKAYAKAFAHDPQYNNKELWPFDSAKSLYAKQKWPKGRVLTWAHPGKSSGKGKGAMNPENWLENGKPATKDIDETCSLVFPPSKKRYWVTLAGKKNPVTWIRHVTIGNNACMIWMHGAKGNTWVKKGGELRYQGWFSGDKHAFVRNDNETSLHIVDHCYIHKDNNASIEFIGRWNVSDSFYPAKGQTIVGPGAQLAPGARSTLIVLDGATLKILTGGIFTRSGNQLFGVDLIVKGTLQAGSPSRPLTDTARLGLSWKGLRRELNGKPHNPRSERVDDVSMLVPEQGQIKIFSKDPKKYRLLIDRNHLKAFRWKDGSTKGKAAGGRERVKKLDTSPDTGINMMLLGKLDLRGIMFNDVKKKGIVVRDPAKFLKNPYLAFGKDNRGKPKELVSRWDGKKTFWFKGRDRDPWKGIAKKGK